MRILVRIVSIAITILCYQCSFAHGLSEDELLNISRAYGYVIAQESVLKQIENDFPSLKAEVLALNLAWENRFPNSKVALISHFKCFGLTEVDIKKAMMQNQNVFSLSKQLEVLSLTDASQRLNYFKNRLVQPSDLDRKIFSILNDVCYSEQPEREFFLDNTVYSSRNNPKANGVDINISVPASWKQADAVRPHIVQKWSKQDESLLLNTMLVVVSSPEIQPYWTKDELTKEIKSGYIWDLFDTSGELLEKRECVLTQIEGFPCVILSALIQHQRVGIRAFSEVSSMFFMFQGNIIMVQFMVMGQQKQNVIANSEKYKKLRNLIFNSVYLPQKYSN